mmetsp:Transcript_14165/g.15833  ORF Transcript_14165/g.15833 Transcript_14165/m.15833 type:complete len:112 (-) Transcript_14165:58-393(-)
MRVVMTMTLVKMKNNTHTIQSIVRPSQVCVKMTGYHPCIQKELIDLVLTLLYDSFICSSFSSCTKTSFRMIPFPTNHYVNGLIDKDQNNDITEELTEFFFYSVIYYITSLP